MHCRRMHRKHKLAFQTRVKALRNVGSRDVGTRHAAYGMP